MVAPPSRIVAAGVLAVLLGLGAGSCGDSRVVAPVGVGPEPAPDPNSPGAALRLLEWCYARRDLDRYRQILTADFSFSCAAVDSAGNVYRSTSFTREDELIFATRLFTTGTATAPPAATISVGLDRTLIAVPDPEFAASDPLGRGHMQVRTALFTRIVLRNGGVIAFAGNVTFSLVRGDSAAIPDDLIARGFGPDSTRWYVREWVEETREAGSMSGAGDVAPAGGAGTGGVAPASWCRLRDIYR